MTESDTKFSNFKTALRQYLIHSIRDFLATHPDNVGVKCLTDDSKWERKFLSIWMMFDPDERKTLLGVIEKIPESLLPELARAFVAGGAYKRRLAEVLAKASTQPRH